jgi:hypothetical protein
MRTSSVYVRRTRQRASAPSPQSRCSARLAADNIVDVDCPKCSRPLPSERAYKCKRCRASYRGRKIADPRDLFRFPDRRSGEKVWETEKQRHRRHWILGGLGFLLLIIVMASVDPHFADGGGVVMLITG